MIGVFGGTFDPIHVGHVAIANEVAGGFQMDQVLFVPNSRSPLRQTPIATGQDRSEMCRLATRENPIFSVSTVEIDRDGPSYAIDTIEILREAYPDDELALIAGMDIVDELLEWRDSSRLLENTLMIVVERPGFDEAKLRDVARELGAEDRILPHRTTPLDISSTEIRRRIKAGLAYRHLLHDHVYQYIVRHGLYRDR